MARSTQNTSSYQYLGAFILAISLLFQAPPAFAEAGQVIVLGPDSNPRAMAVLKSTETATITIELAKNSNNVSAVDATQLIDSYTMEQLPFSNMSKDNNVVFTDVQPGRYELLLNDPNIMLAQVSVEPVSGLSNPTTKSQQETQIQTMYIAGIGIATGTGFAVFAVNQRSDGVPVPDPPDPPSGS